MMKKRNAIISIIIIVLILLGIYIYMQFKIPHIGEFYIRNATENEFSSEELKEIYNILNFSNTNIDIDIYKTACQVDFRHEGNYYIFFYSSEKLTEHDIDDSFSLYCLEYKNGIYEYVAEKICMVTYSDVGYNEIFKICENNYKWWKNNEKSININELQTID